MAIDVMAVRPGDGLEALARVVRAAKGDNPLTPVTVIVPTNAIGVTARRYLGAHGGVAAVDMMTLARVAEVLGGPSLVAEQRRPLSTPVIDLAVRAVLAEQPGAYAKVADHPSTVVALRDLHRELRRAGPHAPTKLAQSSDRGRAAATISTLVTQRLRGGWYDEGDVVERAIAVARSAALPPQLRRIVFLLPHPPLGLDTEFMRALGEAADTHVLLALTGDPATDRQVLGLATTLGDPIDPSTLDPILSIGSAELVSTTDADEEVRYAVRTIVDAAREGVPLNRMAILWPVDQPYARLVEFHLAEAGIPWNGRPGRVIAERVVPRFLLDLLDIDRRGLRRRDLFDLLADLPLRDRNGQRVPVANWERASRAAGVTKDDDWLPRLRRYAARQQHQAARYGDPSSPRADHAEALIEYVDELRAAIGRRGDTRRWEEWADWSNRQIMTRLGSGYLHSLEVAETLAWNHTNLVLDRLRTLDQVGPPVTRSEFRAVFAAEFDVAPGRQGRIGVGVNVGSLSGAVGLDIDRGIILGAADGLMPPAPTSGPLVGESDRVAAGLQPSDAVGMRMHRQFLSVLESAGHTLLLRPRGDLRATASRQVSRWVSATLPQLDERVEGSHHASILSTGFPANPFEHRLRGLLTSVTIDGLLTSEHANVTNDGSLAAAIALRTARRSDSITAYDGDLTQAAIDHFARPVAPTVLESWVACPHAYFMRHILGVVPVEEPGDQMEISAADQGNLAHDALDLFHREVISGQLPQPAQGWSEQHWQRLTEIFDEQAAEFQSGGRTGRDASWQVERTAILSDLQGWFDRDSDRLAANGARVVSSEVAFGDDGSVTLPLPDGRRIAVKGKIDRVDLTSSGQLIVVDHKTGDPKSYKAITAEDPTASGTRMQLPAYAAGAADLLDYPIEGVHAAYSFFEKGGYKQIGYTLDHEVSEKIMTGLKHVVTGIESGLFPAAAEAPGFQLFVRCAYCQPDSLGTGERFPEWERKRSDPRGAQWFADPDAAEPEVAAS